MATFLAMAAFFCVFCANSILTRNIHDKRACCSSDARLFAGVEIASRNHVFGFPQPVPAALVLLANSQVFSFARKHIPFDLTQEAGKRV